MMLITCICVVASLSVNLVPVTGTSSTATIHSSPKMWNCSLFVNSNAESYTLQQYCYSVTANTIPISSLEGKDPILNNSYSLRSASDKLLYCNKAAAGRGFRAFMLHSDGQCYSDKTARETYTTLSPVRCVSGCRSTSNRIFPCKRHNCYCGTGYGSTNYINVYLMDNFRQIDLWILINNTFVNDSAEMFNVSSPTVLNIIGSLKRGLEFRVNQSRLCGLSDEPKIFFMRPENGSIMVHLRIRTTFSNSRKIHESLRNISEISSGKVYRTQQIDGPCSGGNHRMEASLTPLLKDRHTAMDRKSVNVGRWTGYSDFTISILNHCTKPNVTHYQLQLARFSEEYRTFSNLITICEKTAVHVTSVSDSNCKIKPRKLWYGVYYVKLESWTPNDVMMVGFYHGYLKVIKGPLIAHIDGDSSVRQALNHAMFINGSGSYDPEDYLSAFEADVNDLNFTWVCYKRGESVSTETMDKVRQLPVVEYGDLITGGGCFGYGPGRLNQSGPLGYIDTRRMALGGVYYLNLFVEKDVRFKSRLQEITIVRAPPVYDISCLKNCLSRVKTGYRLQLKAFCVSDCPIAHTFTWEMYKATDKRTREGIVVWNKEENLTSWRITNITSDLNVLLLKANVLQKNVTYRLTLKVINTNSRAKIFVHYDFRTNLPPLYGTCFTNPIKGEALLSKFQISCEGWQDENLPLYYECWVLYHGLVLDKLLSYGYSPTVSLTLPVGNSSTNYTLELRCTVFDVLHEGTDNLFNLTVDPPDDPLHAINDYLSRSDSDLNGDDGQKINQASLAILSLLGNEFSQNATTENKTKVKDGMVSSVANQLINGTQGIFQTSGTLIECTSNSTELSVESQMNSIYSVDNMTSLLLENELNSTEFDSLVIDSGGKYLLHLAGNVMEGASSKHHEEENGASMNANNRTKEALKFVAQKSLNVTAALAETIFTKMFPGEPTKDFTSPNFGLSLSKTSVDHIPSHFDVMSGSVEVPGDIIKEILKENVEVKLTLFIARKTILPSQQLGLVLRIFKTIEFDFIGDSNSSKSCNRTEGQSCPTTEQISIRSRSTFIRSNPYFWGEEEDGTNRVNCSVVSLAYETSSDGEISVKNISKPFKIQIPFVLPKSLNNISKYPFFVTPGRYTMHRFRVEHNNTAFDFVIKPKDEVFVTVYVRYGQRPTSTDHDYEFYHPNLSSCVEPTERDNCTGVYDFNECMGIDGKIVPLNSTLCKDMPNVNFLFNSSEVRNFTKCATYQTNVTCPPTDCNTSCKGANCSRGNSSDFNCTNIPLCKNVENFLKCTNILPDRYERCKGLLKKKKLIYGRYEKCLKNRYRIYFDLKVYGKTGYYYVAIHYPAIPPNITSFANVSNVTSAQNDTGNWTTASQVVFNTTGSTTKHSLSIRRSLHCLKRRRCSRNAKGTGRRTKRDTVVDIIEEIWQKRLLANEITKEETLPNNERESILSNLANEDLPERKDNLRLDRRSYDGSTEEPIIENNGSVPVLSQNHKHTLVASKVYDVASRMRRAVLSNNDTARNTRAVSSGDDAAIKQTRRCAVVEEKPAPTILSTPSTFLALVTKPEFNETSSMNYSFDIHVYSCLYWDAYAEIWSTDGCKPHANSTPNLLVCMCDHLTSFSAGILVPPNHIDFDKVFLGFRNIGSNLSVLFTVIGLFLLYFIALILARRADNKDKLMRTTTVFTAPRSNEASYSYEISVYTGTFQGSGTTANVAMVIYGDHDNSYVIPLADGSGKSEELLSRSNVAQFTINTPKCLGPINYISIWHNNGGDNPSWFLHQVVIRDVQTDKKYFYLYSDWLAVDKGDGKIQRRIYTASKKEMTKFRNLFYAHTSKSFADKHLWISVVLRSPTSPFTRVQRVTCCLSLCLSVMLANAMFYKTAGGSHNTIKIGRIQFSLRQIIIGIESSLVAFPLNVLIITLFRKVRPNDERTSKGKSNTKFNKNKVSNYDREDTDASSNKSSSSANDEGNTFKNSNCRLHYWTVYFAYALCSVSSLTSAVFVIFYSMMWGTSKSNEWTISVMVSFIQDIFVVQPLKVVTIAALWSLLFRKPPEDEQVYKRSSEVVQSEREQIDKVNSDNHENLSDHLASFSSSLEPLNDEELIAFREHKVTSNKMKAIFKEVGFHLTFYILLSTVLIGEESGHRYRLSNHMENVFRKTEQVSDTKSFWKWLDTYLIPGLYDTKWYNGRNFTDEEGFMSTKKAFLVGMPRIRQTRVKPVECEATKDYPNLQKFFPKCYPSYSLLNSEESSGISLNDTVLNGKIGFERICLQPFLFQNATALGTLPVVTGDVIYSAGGMVADLGYTLSTAKEVILNIKKDKWVTRQTRGIFIDFTVFEPASNLFAVARFTFEYKETGKIHPSYRIEPLALYGSGSGAFDAVLVACKVILVLMIIFSFIREVVKIIHENTTYLKDVWNVLEVLLVGFGVAMIALHIVKTIYVEQMIKKIQKNPFARMSFDYAAVGTDVWKALASVVIFLATIKLLKILKFNPLIISLSLVMKLSQPYLVSMSALFVVVFMAFAHMGHLVFGPQLVMYSTFMRSFVTEFEMILGKSVFHELTRVAPKIGPLFFFSYFMITTLLLINFFVAVLNDSYEDGRQSIEETSEDLKVAMLMSAYLKSSLQDISDDLKKISRRAVKRETDESMTHPVL